MITFITQSNVAYTVLTIHFLENFQTSQLDKLVNAGADLVIFPTTYTVHLLLQHVRTSCCSRFQYTFLHCHQVLCDSPDRGPETGAA